MNSELDIGLENIPKLCSMVASWASMEVAATQSVSVVTS